MTSPREQLDAYEAENAGHDDHAPKAFAALRAVLNECDFLDACIANYKGHEIAGLIRNSITRALEDQ